MAYIYPAPGVATSEVTLTLSVTSNGSDTGLAIPGLQDVTINNANDVFTWTQLDETAKKQIATTSTNSISTNLVVDQAVFFGTTGVAPIDTAAEYGIFGLSKDKVKVDFSIFLGKTDAGGAGKTISGSGYITGLAPTTSADSPVWVTPVTITVDGEYTVA